MLAEPFFADHPLFAPLRPLLGRLSSDGGMPGLRQLNALATDHGIITGNGAALRFVVPHGSGMSYDERIWWLGEVETRPGNWHDAFNALVWLGFPQTKAVLNARNHHAARRHPRRDALNRFDECGVILTSPDPGLWAKLRTQGRESTFRSGRSKVPQSLEAKAFLFGHASLNMLRTPHIGQYTWAAFLHTDEEWLAQPAEEQLADIDARMARRFASELNAATCQRDIHPLLLQGAPDAGPDSECSGFPAEADSAARSVMRNLPPRHLVYNRPNASGIIGI